MSSHPPAKSRIVCYTSDQIPYVWDRVEGHIKRALDRGSNYCTEDILEGLCNKSMQLWTWQSAEIEAAMVTTIQTKEDVKYCLFLALGGENLKDWIQHLPIVEKWAKDEGCEEMRIYGRSGWARHIGYKIEYTKMVKEL